MNIQARPYRDSTDMARMQRLLMDGSQANISASYMHPGCLDWDTHRPPSEQENRRNLRLWERIGGDEPTLEAWAIRSRHEGTFDLFVSPTVYGTAEHEAVMAEYVTWAETRAHEVGLKQLAPFWAMEYDTFLAHLYQAHGFVVIPCDPAPPLFERTLDDLPTIALPEGFTVQGVHSLNEGQLRARVLHGAWNRPNDEWEGDAAAYAQFMESAVYDGERDLFVRAPDGRGASACTIWFDPVNAVGLFEPVGTHPDFQGQGLGKAVMAEGLRRMKAAGMQRAILGFDPNNRAALALYTSLGFRASCYFAIYRKEV
jgi:mycothiol synthase